MSETEPNLPIHTRSAMATRDAILQAARRQFMARSYDQVGVRDIAADAGVNAALVIRYFGSKEQLFTEMLTAEVSLAPLFVGERAGLGERLARSLLQKEAAAGQFNPMIALLRSLGSEHGITLFRQLMDEQFTSPLAARMEGEDRALRASLIAASVTGLVISLTVVQSAALNDAELDTLVAWVGPMLQHFIDGPTQVVPS